MPKKRMLTGDHAGEVPTPENSDSSETVVATEPKPGTANEEVDALLGESSRNLLGSADELGCAIAETQTPKKTKVYFYWFGIKSDFGRGQVDINLEDRYAPKHERKGLPVASFTKTTEKIAFNDAGQQIRLACRGHVQAVTTEFLEALYARLRRMIAREAGWSSEGATKVGARKRRAHQVLTAHTKEDFEKAYEIAERSGTNLPKPYVRQGGDKPLAAYLWCVPLNIKEHRSQLRDAVEEPPSILEVGGIELPGDDAIEAAPEYAF